MIYFAGGGTGGHVYPNVAVAERLGPMLAERGKALRAVYAVSDRAVDARVCEAEGLEAVALPARPAATRPDRALRFAAAFRRARAVAARRVAADRPAALLATGGFVSGPAVAAARRAGVPTALITLDAVAGRAARWLARGCDARFLAVAGAGLPEAKTVGYPLRSASLAAGRDPGEARAGYGLNPRHPTLLVFAGSSGAETINRGSPAFFADRARDPRLRGWQVLHLTGGKLLAETRAAYAAAGVAAAVRGYEPAMGRAWAAADLALTRCGAGGVAEARANAVPCVFLPYPWHRDGHQERNAGPLVAAGGAVVTPDRVAPAANAASLGDTLLPLLENPARRAAMRAALRAMPATDAATALAAWLLGRAGGGPPADGRG
ncbi:UDP-N-acetylglucosamine--N-acetylmuramyl-(pentapeptide) pyrophosphoryl-undecaprenol N-acetylglucosamine transferase [Phycisphaera mikurensis]|uniref:UDP-N-acetylglucosamine--N-acetylmuramyl- (pentapeptide) pyrophosphoryl-undecaprenol N-acetylglucosamine transferase n=1 Tax=Phycisphaera mikurensis TaxID=547188 RepID=UPI0014614D45|nr:UDP-N-acetylglucosamine--N-acetylmuramyl-(pentapeptide) pyrophosphoryl-undecaprenol N-acetylglucosamine transferase [Phycisphaera mikurensis]MBB6442168.1 UDP-N-acetylglucosamine--N-acetylmuramyl-(pentapeptide) pyrophosphoryl-undecaprenol N-acetylglucosamine transferase [Phycisphaera mikurensis]